MKKNHLPKWCNIALCILLSQFLFLSVSAQQIKYHAKDDISLIISGTSTLHDWDMKGAKGEVEAVFTLNNVGRLHELHALSVNVPAESLKSEFTAMDKNAYKALKTNKVASITYHLVSASVAADGTIKTTGKLSIAGTTIITNVDAIAKINPDKSISVSGSKQISMKEYGITPPTFMMGTIKTGNDIVLKFSVTLKNK